MRNILTVDVEDWYMDTDISRWAEFEDRIVTSTNIVLSLLGDTKATFFLLGYVAEHHPELVSQIHDAGHEVGTHGYCHKSILMQTPHQFKEDLLKSINIIESIIGERVYGHRACQFSVMRSTAWSVDVMTKCGLLYDSSVFPVKTQLYGVPDAPLFPYRISSEHLCGGSDKGILELPLSVYHMPFMNLPIAGGFYLRFFPYWFIKKSIKEINMQSMPAVIYLHPWELDVKQPKIPELKWYHYHNLNSMMPRFKRLLKDFKFTSVREWLNSEANSFK